jgi:hypothetical protein
MDTSARNQYLKVLQKEYFIAKCTKEKSSILDEYCRNTRPNRKYVITKINSSVSSTPRERRKRIHRSYVRKAPAKVEEIFHYLYGQRVAPLLKNRATG